MPAVEVLIPRSVEEEFPGRVASVDPQIRVRLVDQDGSVEGAEAPRVLMRGNIRNEAMQRLLEEYPTIEWVHVSSAGVEHLLPLLEGFGGIVTNSAGLYAEPIAEWVIAMMLMHAKRLRVLVERFERREWQGVASEEIGGKTLGIIGTGGIGTAIARRARGLGMHVVGMRASGKPSEHVERMYTPNGLHEMLGLSDYVVIATPLTEQTAGLIGEPELRAMQPSAVLLNIARGRIVQTEALVRALEEGWIAAAYLDVTDPEPLPPEHPLWGLPNVFITPHTSGHSPLSSRRVLDFFISNLRRWLQGEPLRNVVNLERGY